MSLLSNAILRIYINTQIIIIAHKEKEEKKSSKTKLKTIRKIDFYSIWNAREKLSGAL